MEQIYTRHGKINLPAFFPDATRASVKTVDSRDLKDAKTTGLVVNTFHLQNSFLGNVIKSLGGIHAFMNWPHPVISDSGGFQIMSMIRENPRYGKILDDKIIFRPEKGGKKIFTPEKCIRLQLKLKSDILMCLDDCTRPDDALSLQEKSVERTIRWAERCRAEFDRLNQNSKAKPLLFAIIQGGRSKELRKKCVKALQKIGFDGYGFGGFPFDGKSNLVSAILEYTAQLMPAGLPKYAMGIGSPEHIVRCFKMGYGLFDSVVPTRNARHKKLYVFNGNIANLNILEDNFYQALYLDNPKLMKDKDPVSSVCDCPLCRNYSRAYLYNLFKSNDGSAFRLATIHNLRFYSQLTEFLKKDVL